MSDYPLKDHRTEEERQKGLFEAMRKNLAGGMTEEQMEDFRKLGEKFHESFDVTRGTTKNMNEINMEEALAYVTESLKSGIHPSYLGEDEKVLLEAAYGKEWFKKWGYEANDLETL